jgi:hypothetical protein
MACAAPGEDLLQRIPDLDQIDRYSKEIPGVLPD